MEKRQECRPDPFGDGGGNICAWNVVCAPLGCALVFLLARARRLPVEELTVCAWHSVCSALLPVLLFDVRRSHRQRRKTSPMKVGVPPTSQALIVPN